MTYGVVYALTNKSTGKVYVGQTTLTLEVRWKRHCTAKKGCTALIRALKKYGPQSFTKRVLCKATTRAELNAYETYWIAKLDSLAPKGYNLRTDAVGGGWTEVSRKRVGLSIKAARQRMAARGDPKGLTSLSASDVAHIFKMFDEGWLQKDIAAHFKVVPSTVAHILKGSTWSHLRLTSNRNRRRKLTRDEVREVLQLFYTEGLTVAEIRRLKGVQKACVNKILRGASHPDLYQSLVRGRPRTRHLELRSRVKAARKQFHWSYPRLGREFNISTGQAWRLCRP